MWCRSGRRFTFCLPLVLIAVSACMPATAQVVVSTNFEDAQTDGWIPRGHWHHAKREHQSGQHR